MKPLTDQLLRRFTRVSCCMIVARYLLLALAAGISLALAVCLADRLVALRSSVRLIGWISIAAMMLAIAFRGLRLAQSIARSRLVAAMQIEARDDHFAQRLITVVSAAPAQHGVSPQMLARLEDEVEQLAATIHLAQLLRLVPLLQAAVLATMLVVIAGLAWRSQWFDLPRVAQRVALPLASITPASSTRLVVQPGNTRAYPGATLVIEAHTQSQTAGAVMLYTCTDAKNYIAHTMIDRHDRSYRYVYPMNTSAVSYYVTAGDAISETFRIDVDDQPATPAPRPTAQIRPWAASSSQPSPSRGFDPAIEAYLQAMGR